MHSKAALTLISALKRKIINVLEAPKFVSKENEDDRGWVSINDLNQRKTFVEKPDGGLFEKRVKFLNKSILDTTFLKIRTAGLKNSTEWTIRFFVGSPQERWLQNLR